MLRGVLVMVACAACADVPDPPINPVQNGVLSVTADGANVTGKDFTITFASTGIRLPTSLKHGTDEVFATESCPEPSLAGVSLAPMETAVGGHAPPGLDQELNTATAERTGPAMVRVIVEYQVPYNCGGKQTFGGSSTFTIFPSGRIVRHDVVTPTNAAGPLSTASCGGCGGSGTATVFNTFWNFAGGGVRSEVDMAGNIRPLQAGEEGRSTVSCASYATHALAIAWSSNGNPHALDELGSLAYSFDFFPPTTTVTNGLQLSASMLLVGDATSCDDLLGHLFLPDLVIDDGEVKPLELDIEYMYTHEDRYAGGAFEIRTADRSGFTEGFAIKLDIGGIPDHLRVQRRSKLPVDYLVQDDFGQTIIWIAGGIAAGDGVIVEAL